MSDESEGKSTTELAGDQILRRSRSRSRLETDGRHVHGRWEADPDRSILSSGAPLAQQFAGKRVGDEFDFEHPGGGTTRYKIVSISSALDIDDWDSES